MFRFFTFDDSRAAAACAFIGSFAGFAVGFLFDGGFGADHLVGIFRIGGAVIAFAVAVIEALRTGSEFGAANIDIITIGIFLCDAAIAYAVTVIEAGGFIGEFVGANEFRRCFFAITFGNFSAAGARAIVVIDANFIVGELGAANIDIITIGVFLSSAAATFAFIGGFTGFAIGFLLGFSSAANLGTFFAFAFTAFAFFVGFAGFAFTLQARGSRTNLGAFFTSAVVAFAFFVGFAGLTVGFLGGSSRANLGTFFTSTVIAFAFIVGRAGFAVSFLGRSRLACIIFAAIGTARNFLLTIFAGHKGITIANRIVITGRCLISAGGNACGHTGSRRTVGIGLTLTNLAIHTGGAALNRQSAIVAEHKVGCIQAFRLIGRRIAFQIVVIAL